MMNVPQITQISQIKPKTSWRQTAKAFAPGVSGAQTLSFSCLPINLAIVLSKVYRNVSPVGTKYL